MRLSLCFGTLVVPALVSLLVVPGCARTRGATAQQPARVPADAAATAVRSSDPVALELGDWTVVSHRLPGVGAMTDAEAARWHGRVAHYASDLAVFGPDSCRGPSYRSREVRGDSLLGVAYHVAPSAFGLAPKATITLIEIRCVDSPWIAPGGTLLRMPDWTTYTVWDGTFFELGRR